jgi:hypothetical protein
MTKTVGKAVFARPAPVLLVLVLGSLAAGCSERQTSAVLDSSAAVSDSSAAVSDGSAAVLDGGAAILDGNSADGPAASRFHAPGSSTPTACLACHRNQAPTSAEGWHGTAYTRSPFDYGTNALGIRHGGGRDCAVCHVGPGTGAWGDNPNWMGGYFAHGSSSPSDETCIACHVSQRPDLQPGATALTAASQVGFDHVPSAALDCIACHEATVAAGAYADYFNPVTGSLPGGDWKGGQSYPGAVEVGFPYERIELQATTLNRSSGSDFVTSATVAWQDLPDKMVHTAAAVPPELRPGPVDAPDYGKCWHCHGNGSGVIKMFRMGKFHMALDQYAVTADAPMTPLPQPTGGCKECHAATQPIGIVSRSTLRPMDHAIELASPVTVNGVTAAGVKDMECSTCHFDPSSIFAGATFHASLAAAKPADCVSCHYVTMADAALADVESGTSSRMRHTSAQVTFQTCTTCHPSALANAADPAVAAESWRPGYYHAVLPVPPGACVDCHAVSVPGLDAATVE